MNVEPLPQLLRTSIFPCSASSRFLTIVNPRPLPPACRVIEPSICRNGSNDTKVFFFDPDAGILNREDDSRFCIHGGKSDGSPLRKFNRIGDQVQENLPDP